MGKRANRNAKEDRSQAERFLLTRKWLCDLPCEEFRPKHSLQLVEELKATISEETGKPLSHKYVSNLYGLYATACRDARIAELMPFDPCVLPKGKLRRKSKKSARVNYEVDDILALMSCPDNRARVFALLALLTGMREGEVCGRRWRDWDQHSVPLGCLSIESQYDDQPLKGDRHEVGEAARKAPVHPVLAEVLAWWWSDGFEFAYCRKPTRDDWIVPRRFKGDMSLPHTRSSAYKLWRKACERSGVQNRSLHSTRHTFLTLTQRGGAQKVVVEQITHNASGDTVDQYTHWAWAPLCEAVLCLRPNLDSFLDSSHETPEKRLPNGGGAGNRKQGIGPLATKRYGCLFRPNRRYPVAFTKVRQFTRVRVGPLGSTPVVARKGGRATGRTRLRHEVPERSGSHRLPKRHPRRIAPEPGPTRPRTYVHAGACRSPGCRRPGVVAVRPP